MLRRRDAIQNEYDMVVDEVARKRDEKNNVRFSSEIINMISFSYLEYSDLEVIGLNCHFSDIVTDLFNSK